MRKPVLLKQHARETKLFTARIIQAYIVIAILASLLVSRLVYLQIIEHSRYTTLARDNQVSLIPLAPKRGLIYDRNGVLLAQNIPVYSLDIIPDYVPNLKQTLAKLQEIIDITPEDLQEFYKARARGHPFEPIPLKMKLTEEEAARFYVNQYRFPGVRVSARLMRFYPLGEEMTPILGYVGRINEHELQKVDPTNYSATNYIGKLGIEKHYESELHGQVGYQQVETDASGRIVRVLKMIAPTAGNDLYLTIDSRLQAAAEQALGDRRGAVVAIVPSTGEVLAFVSHPSYDPNLFVHGISQAEYQALRSAPDKPLYNRALRGLYPIASPIKPYLALAALSNNRITPDFTVFDPGWFRLPNNDHIYHDWRAHGRVDVSRAITVSCDTFFYTISVKMGIDLIDEALAQFGFGKHTGIDVDEELPGLVPSPAWKRKMTGQRWYTGDTVNSSIGQGFMLATPLQMADGVAGLANRGKRIQPHFLLSEKTADGRTVPFTPVPLPSVTWGTPQAWNLVIQGMTNVIASPEGTAHYSFGRTPYTVAGKTGTGQVYRPKKYYNLSDDLVAEKYRSNAIFVAFAPVEQPQIAVSVVIENTPHAAPGIVRKVMDAYFLPTTTQKSDDNTKSGLKNQTAKTEAAKTQTSKAKINTNGRSQQEITR